MSYRGQDSFANHRTRPIKAIIHASDTPGRQKYVIGSQEVEMPLGAVQQLPKPAQAAVFLSALAAIVLPTYVLVSGTDISWTRSDAAPYVMGLIFTLGGSAHFTAHEDYCSMMPTKVL